ncbi:MAG TPA: DUF2339 domain-containing protein [Bacilli bacterium]|nr:DUF2339 domain-containing protein [Bacilli bacterium]
MEDKARWERLEARVTELEAELRQLKAQLDTQGQEVSRTGPLLQKDVRPSDSLTARQQPMSESEQEAGGIKPAPREHPVDGVVPEFTPDKEPVDWEQVLGRVWLPRIFIFVLLLGVLWGFSAAVKMGLVTEPVRVALGALATLALLFVGERQMKAGHDALGQVLLGGAVSVGVLTVFAAHILYGLIPGAVSFGLDVLLVGGGVYLAHRHKSQALAILATVGGYLVPFLVESEEPHTVFLVSYETILSIAFLLFALKYRYTVLYYTSLTLYHLVLFLYGVLVNLETAEMPLLFYGALVQQATLLAAALRTKVADRQPLGTLFGSFTLVILWMYASLSDTAIEVWLLVFTALYGALAYLRRADRERSFPVLLAVAFFALMLYAIQVLEGIDMALPLLVEGAVGLWLGLRLRSVLQLLTGSLIFFLGTMATLFFPIQDLFSMETLSWLVLLAALAFLYRTSVRLADGAEELRADLYRMFGRVFLIAASALTLVFLTEVTLELTESWDWDSTQMAISFVWALYAILGIVYGILRHSRAARVVGVVLLFVTLLKLVFVDLPSVSIVVRAILFIGIGALGVGVSRLFYQKKGASE